MISEPAGLIKVGEQSIVTSIIGKRMESDVYVTGVSKLIVEESPLSTYIYYLIRKLPEF
jgi:hypothetical protein